MSFGNAFFYIRAGLVASRTLNDCLIDVTSNTYTGTVSVSNHGYTCEAWANLTNPQALQLIGNDAYFPADGSVAGARNYCRKFVLNGRPWCYTAHPHVIRENCDLQICNGNLQLICSALLYTICIPVSKFRKQHYPILSSMFRNTKRKLK